MPSVSPYLGLDTLYLFKRYQTREEYARLTGKQPPEWNPRRPPKYWEDPEALKSTRRTVVYDVLAVQGGSAVPGPDGNPQYDLLAIPKEEAATVNIPPNFSNVEGADAPEVPVPLRQLQPYERLVFGFGGVVSVRDTRVALPVSEESGEILALLRRIAAKLGA